MQHTHDIRIRGDANRDDSRHRATVVGDGARLPLADHGQVATEAVAQLADPDVSHAKALEDTSPVTGPTAKFCRFQAAYCGRLGVEVGLFVAVDHLRRAGSLSADELATYLDVDDWFHEHLPEPAFYTDGNSVGAVTWFKAPMPIDMAQRAESLMAILMAHDVAHEMVCSDDPGRVIYEDEFQVGVIPRSRKERTPLPADLVLGPTTAASKRELPHGPVVS